MGLSTYQQSPQYSDKRKAASVAANARLRELWADPQWAATKSEVYRQASLRRWQDPAFREKCVSAMRNTGCDEDRWRNSANRHQDSIAPRSRPTARSLTVDQVREIRNAFEGRDIVGKEAVTLKKQLAAKFDCHRNVIHYLLSGRTYKAVV